MDEYKWVVKSVVLSNGSVCPFTHNPCKRGECKAWGTLIDTGEIVDEGCVFIMLAAQKLIR